MGRGVGGGRRGKGSRKRVRAKGVHRCNGRVVMRCHQRRGAKGGGKRKEGGGRREGGVAPSGHTLERSHNESEQCLCSVHREKVS